MASSQRWVQCPKCGEGSFDVETYSTGEQYGFCIACGYYHNITFMDEHHPEEGLIEDIGGGFGVETVISSKTNCGFSRSLAKGEMPEITEETVFASAMIDGKLVILKQHDEE